MYLEIGAIKHHGVANAITTASEHRPMWQNTVIGVPCPGKVGPVGCDFSRYHFLSFGLYEIFIMENVRYLIAMT